MFIPTTPSFKLYKTKIRHGTNKNKVETKVIGIKCTADKVCLLKEYFSQLASPTNYKKQIGIFVPTGVVHLVRTANYAKIICNNNSFLQNVITIPIGDLQHATLDIPFSLQANTDIDQITLQEVLWINCGAIALNKPPTRFCLSQTKAAKPDNW